jgi:hypothetical protein
MKKTLSAFVMLSMLIGFAPKKAEAGFCILAATQEFVWKHKYETLDTVLVIALPVAAVTTGIFAVGIAGNPFNGATLVAGAVLLGESVESKKSDISSALIKRYPSLSDDQAAVKKLTDLIVAKYPSAKDADGNAMIFVTEKELAEATASLDLSSADHTDLVNTLTK